MGVTEMYPMASACGVRIAAFVLLDRCVCQPVIDMTSRVYPAIVSFKALEIALPCYADSADFVGGQVRDVDIEAYAGRQPFFPNLWRQVWE